jgi:hypothetical protein
MPARRTIRFECSGNHDRELMEFLDCQRAPLTRPMLDRRYPEQALVNSLPAPLRVAENPFQQLKLVESRARMLLRSLSDEVFEGSSPKVGQLDAPEGGPDLGGPPIEPDGGATRRPPVARCLASHASSSSPSVRDGSR